MRLKPKTIRRLLLLSVAVAATGTMLGAVVGLRAWQRERIETRVRAEGMSASAAGNHEAAVAALERYLRRRPDDAEALLALARSRARAEQRDGRHIAAALQEYRRYLGLRPEDREARAEVLALYATAGMHQEARDEAARMRPRRLEDAGVEHLGALRAEAAARAALGAFNDDLGAIARRIVELEPTDLDAGLLYCDWLVRSGRDREALQWARAGAESRPGDPRARLLVLLAELGTPESAQPGRLVEGLCALTGLDPATGHRTGDAEYPDDAYGLRVAALFDQGGRQDLARAALRDGADAAARPMTFALYVRRSWQVGALADVLSATDALDAGAPSEALGFRGLALETLGRGDEADALRTRLDARRGDLSAQAWSASMQAARRSPASPVTALASVDEAVAARPGEPVFRYQRAELLAALGRIDEACTEWRRAGASPLAVGWARPWVRLAQAAVGQGRIDEAVTLAERAAGIARAGFEANLVWFETLVAQRERSAGPTGREADLLRFAEQIESQARALPDRSAGRRLVGEVLPGHAVVLSRVGRRDEAVASLRAAIRDDPPLDRAVLERIAIVSLRENLGVEDEAIAAARSAHGPAPSTESVYAAVLHARGRTAEAVNRLRGAVASAGPDSRLEWSRALATFLDVAGDPAAAGEWVALADSAPDDLAVQLGALRSSSASRDPEFVERVATRVARLSGAGNGDAPLVRLARARALLAGRPTLRQRDEAIRLIREVVAARPQLAEPRLLLVDALLIDDPERGLMPDIAGAIAETRSAATVSADPGPVRLRAAALMQRRRDFRAARDELVRLAAENRSDPSLAARAAAMLVAQGDVAEAIPIYESVVAVRPTPEYGLALAESYALVRRDADALAQFRALADNPPDAPDAALDVAVWLHRLGDRERGDETAQAAAAGLARPDALVFQGRYRERVGDAEGAEAQFRSAIAADPSNIEARDALIQLLVASGRSDEARSAIEDARRALPDNPRTRAMLDRASAVAGGAEPDLLALARASGDDPAGVRAAAAYRAVDEARRSGAFDSPAELSRLADRFQDNPAVQMLVVRRLLSLSPPAPESAAAIAERAASSFPALPEPARLAAAAYAALGRWDRALTAAESWRRRDSSRPLEAEAAVAEAQLRLGAADRAAATLEPCLDRARSEIATPGGVQVLGVHARALVAAGRADAALASLARSLDGSAELRERVFLPMIGALPSVEAASGWLDRAAPSFVGASRDQRAALADAYATLAARAGSERGELLRKARDVLDPMLADPSGASPAAWEASARVHEAAGEFEAAAGDLDRALTLEPSRATAAERLVELRGTALKDPAGAIAAAGRFAQANPGVAAMMIEARAEVIAADAGVSPVESRRRALDQYRRVLDADAARLDAMLSAAAVAEALGDHRAVADFYERALSAPGLAPELRAGLQNNAAYALLRLGGAEELRRARALARSAVSVGRHAAFLDTLARIEGALGARTHAVNIYRDALEADPTHVSARLGLAGLLASGTAGEAAEAARIIEALEADRAAGRVNLGDERMAELTEVKRRLGGGR